MFEQEKKRATHLLILLVYTFLTIALTGESLLLGWEMGAIVLLLLALIASWVLHITEIVPESTRLWLYFVLMMLAAFFYGIHETSIYDLAALMVVVIILYSATENYNIIRLCVGTYFFTMGYDFVFVLGGSIEKDPLTITRLLLHLVLVYMAGFLVKIAIQRRGKEREKTDDRIAGLEEINRRTEDFLTNVSHELRTPINAVTGLTSVMLKNEEDAEKKKDIFSIHMAGNRLFNQIEDILDYTEIDTERVKVSEDTYMVTSLVNDMITGNLLWEREDMPELIFDIDTGIPSVLLGDEKKIKKILKHLLDNALKFTHKGGVYVRIFALPKPYGINLCIRVSDTGVGIAQEELGRITELFYQSSGGRNRRAGGLGLGLSIVYGMVKAMKGFIKIESTAGKGTTVSVSIPQKVLDETPGMVINHREKLCLACFLMPEKYEVPEVRDYYSEAIFHLVQGLDIPFHKVSNREELEKLNAMCQLTHLFIGKEEYMENKSYLEHLDEGIQVIMVANDSCALSETSRVQFIRKPFFGLPVVNILNADASEDVRLRKNKHMLCSGVRVLVVDDEPMNLLVAQGILEGYQMHVTTVESGRKAISICEREDFDLILLDHMMPEMDGVETLKLLRRMQTEQDKVFTIIAFTANAVSGARDMFLQEGFDEFVSKPVEPLELERVLKKVLPKASIVYEDKKATHQKQEKGTKKPPIPEDRTANVQPSDTSEHGMVDAQPPDIPADRTVDGQDTSSEEQKKNRLEGVGIHTHSGLQYCAGDRDFYVELLASFVKEAGQKAAKIKAYYQKQDFENYGILVHALKSTAKMIGADSLSENAKRAEEAAKKQDADYIGKHQEELAAQYHEVVQCITEVLGLDKKETVQEEPQQHGDDNRATGRGEAE